MLIRYALCVTLPNNKETRLTVMYRMASQSLRQVTAICRPPQLYPVFESTRRNTVFGNLYVLGREIVKQQKTLANLPNKEHLWHIL